MRSVVSDSTPCNHQTISSDTNRSSRRRRAKPKKPAKPKGFPLTPNGNGQWSKKINGKVYYFGTWDDPDGALKRYLEVAQNLAEGRPARSENPDGLTVRELANEFLTFKQHKVDTGELAPRTFSEYRDTCERLIRVLGRDLPVERIQAGELLKLREDIAKSGASIKTLANEIGRARVVLNFAWKEGLIDRPIGRSASASRSRSPARQRFARTGRSVNSNAGR